MVPNEINVTYSMYDRFIFGGAVPATKELVLETIDPLKAKFFWNAANWVLSTLAVKVS